MSAPADAGAAGAGAVAAPAAADAKAAAAAVQPAPAPIVSAEEERKQLVASYGKPPVKGEMWYVISRKWLQQFCDYTGFVAERPNTVGRSGAQRPNAINNADIMLAGCAKELRKDLTPADYELLHPGSWDLLNKWYGGGPVIRREVITVGLMQSERIELYPAFLTLLSCDASGTPQPMANAKGWYSCFGTLLDVLHAHQPGFDGKEPDKKKENMRCWVRDDGKRNTTDEVLSKAADVQAGKAPVDEKTLAEERRKEDEKKGIHTGWKLVHGDTYEQKLEVHEFKCDTELLLEYRKDSTTDWSRRTGKKDWKSYEMNDILDCSDHRGVWFEALIRDVKEEKMLIHFINWSTKWDEWLPKNSTRLGPRNHMTTGPYLPKEEGPSLQRLHSTGTPPAAGAVGLRNLGNTCFMNSTLQCLSNTPGLTQFFVEDKFLSELNTNNALGWGGKIAVEYSKMIKEIWSGKYTSVAPRALKDAIGEFQPRFSGYQQHDSSELLSFLLDGLHEDLNRVKKKPATQPVDSGGRQDNIVAIDSWYRHLQRNRSIIVDTCQGQLKSRVVCPECKRESITFDPFMFLSVPLPEPDTMVQTVTFLPHAPGSVPKVYHVKCSKAGQVGEMKTNLGRMTNTNPAHFIVAEVWSNRLYKIFPNDYALLNFGARDAIWVYENPPQNAAADARPDAPAAKPEAVIQAQLSHFVGKDKRFQMAGAPTIVRFRPTGLDKYPNAEIHAVCKAAAAPFVKDAKWADGEVPPYEIWVCDKGGKEPRDIIPNDNGVTNLSKGGGFSICLRWPDLERWGSAPVDSGAGDEPTKKGLSLDDCMEAFTKEEVLRQSEAWYCSKCKKHLCATKKFDVYKSPDILILHLKRFSYNHLWRDKISTLVDFPVEGLDIRPWVVNKDEKDTLYDLYAVSNHFGGLGGGHYTAYAKNILDNKWYNLDDSSVSPLGNPNAVRTPAAYVLFYKRRSAKMPGTVRQTLEATAAAAAALGATEVGKIPIAEALKGEPGAPAPAAGAGAGAAAAKPKAG